VEVRVRFFAALRERAGATARHEVRRGTTVGALWRRIVSARPELGRVPVRFAVNGEYVPAAHRLGEDDEVAIFPPVSGGM
jgi:molybdopterin converting factor subunit 1